MMALDNCNKHIWLLGADLGMLELPRDEDVSQHAIPTSVGKC